MVSIDWIVVNHRLSTDELKKRYLGTQTHYFAIPGFTWFGPGTYSITIEVPPEESLNQSQMSLYLGDPIESRIVPDGLLEPRMIAKGELVILILITSSRESLSN